MKIQERQRDHQRLLNNLKILQRLYSKAALCELLNISSATWTNRMKEPWRLFSYDDFKALATYCHINFADLMEGTLGVK